MAKTSKSSESARRIIPIDRDRELYPLRRARDLSKCALYWLPTFRYPTTSEVRSWTLEFMMRLSALLADKQGLRIEIFLQYMTASKLSREMYKTAKWNLPQPGLARAPGAPIKELPDAAELQKDLEKFTSGAKKPPSIEDIAPTYAYWFLGKHPKEQLETFLGYGGLICAFLPPDPNTQIPPELEDPFPAFFLEKMPKRDKVDVDGTIAALFAMQDEFLDKSKELFGSDLKDEPQFEGLAFIIPLLRSQDFFQAEDETVKAWFELFGVYVAECPEDGGMLVASADDMDEDLIGILDAMREDEFRFPSNS